MRKHTQIVQITILAVVAVILGGCLTPVKSVPAKRYDVVTDIEVEKAKPTEHTLGVRKLEAARPYRQRIVYREDGYVLGEYAYAEWAELPADVVTFALIEAITATEKFNDVGNASNMNAPSFLLTGQLKKFDEVRTTDPWTAVCEVRLVLRPTFGTGEIWSGLITSTVPLAQNQVSALPEAMSKAVADVVQQVANQIAAQPLPDNIKLR